MLEREYPAKPHRAETLFYAAMTALSVVICGVMVAADERMAAIAWFGVVLAWSCCVVMAARIAQLRNALDTVVVHLPPARPGSGGTVLAVIATRHPGNYLLHNTGDGTRWRLTDAGRWQREDW